MSRRVVITGVGLISSIGNDYATVLAALKNGQSGTRAMPKWGEYGVKSLVAGTIEGIEEKESNAGIPPQLRPGMSDGALYAALAAQDAIRDAGLTAAELETPRTGCTVGTSAVSVDSVYRAGELCYSSRIRRIDPYLAFRCMTNSAPAAIANWFKIPGRSYGIGSACATGSHNIGHAFELIRSGAMDRMIAGGAEDISLLIAGAFHALRMALSTHYNDTPGRACRPYDAARDGLVLSGGAGVVVLEDLESARCRRARARAEIIGYGANSDGYDLALPEPEGRQAAQCMRMALDDAGLRPSDVDYINTHGTATVAGDLAEVKGLQQVFGERLPPFSSTKSMTGHSVGASGAHELIFCTGMLEEGFLAPSINIDHVDPDFAGLPIVRKTVHRNVRITLSNNFGFGGTNATLILRRMEAA